MDERETKIRDSVDNAEKIESELAEIEGKRSDILADADTKAKDILTTSRKGAVEAARVIENKAREETQIMLENAEREINTAQERARATLRQESADLAVSLAGKVIEDNLDEEKSKALINKLIGEM